MALFSETAIAILGARYFRRDDTGRQIEDAQAMLERVASAIARPCAGFGEDSAEWRDRFLERMSRLEFLPNSPTLMNAGVQDGQLAACFVLPIEDDLESIFGSLGMAARIQQTGGGTGFSFSRLRPRGDVVRSTGGISSGPVSFMALFDHATAVIRAGGRRRGANMAVLDVAHPDVEEFINVKRKPGVLENFNLSVALTDDFFSALESNSAFALRNPRSGAVERTVSARRIFDSIAESATAVGDPGLLFMDEINRHNPVPALGRIEATNPCGEQPLIPYECCTLGSINLGKFASGGAVNWSALGEAIRDAVVFLDNVIEANRYPDPAIREATLRTRKIGLGVMGLADMLAAIGVPYDSDAAITLGGEIAEFLTETARTASVKLGERRGPFPAFEKSVWPQRGYTTMRNAAVTCVAPTGTIGIIAGASGGIEPFFALATARRALDNQTFIEPNALLEAELARSGPAGEHALEIARRTGSIQSAPGVSDEIKRHFPVALEISPEFHLRMQAAFQRHIDAAVSKTVNLPRNTEPETVREIFMMAHDLRLKGVSVYRYGSRPGQTLSLVEDSLTPDCRECSV